MLTERSIHQRGGALLAVLWLSAALSAIAFTVATTVRGETERTSTAVEGIRSYYLATGGLERALVYIQWAMFRRSPDGVLQYYIPGQTYLHFNFPSGVADVEVIPEAAKLNINQARPEFIARLLVNLGAEPEQAQLITTAIEDWRKPAPGGMTEFDQFYMNLTPSFRARHASLEEIEELVQVRGMTPDLFYGSYARNAAGQLIGRPGFRDCVSVFGSLDRFDANTAEPALLAAVGMSFDAIQVLMARRQRGPILKQEEIGALSQAGGVGWDKLRIGGSSIFTLRSTGRLHLGNGRFSDLRRTVAAMVKFFGPGVDPLYQTLRWYDNAWRMEPLVMPANLPPMPPTEIRQ